ncbi:hypothetical protein [Pedobacter cryophilus]|uniref:Uncharacterized protein n=1 Tax=Pedobacter cryophilus TaxID=2571271 RepID=A0A4U1BZF1_9SPHI|nr:hypothetical protein [Pedobacter cryophilus]TKB98658.1 hypothetical protein FA046_05945 [Pedobacter cryophilus]
MYTEAKKLHLIEEVLKIKSDITLDAVENFLKHAVKSVKKNKKESSFSEFSGIWSKGEASEIEQIITESCEIINPDDWK